MISDAIKIALIKTAPTLSHIELIELVEYECELVQQRYLLKDEEFMFLKHTLSSAQLIMDVYTPEAITERDYLRRSLEVLTSLDIKENRP
jgi:hypothetical protein